MFKSKNSKAYPLLRTGIVGCAFLVLESAGATDLSSSYSTTVNTQSAGWSRTATIPRFDPAIGTLTSVEIQLNGLIRSTPRAENLDNQARHLVVGSAGVVTLFNPATAFTYITVAPQVTTEQDVTEFDGVTDYAGNGGGPGSGFVVDPPLANSAHNHFELHDSDAEFANFIGTGLINLALTGQGYPVASGANGISSQISTDVGAELQITYFYSTQTATIEGTVWLDANQDGMVNASEVGLPGIPVTLTDLFGNAVPGVLPQVTDAQGHYSLTGITVPDINGSVYTVAIGQPGPYLPTYDFDDGLTGVPSSPNAAVLFLTPQQHQEEVNFGFYDPNALPPVYGSLGNFVWHDVNGNGIQDPGETGINGVEVTLLRCDGTPTGLTATTASVGGAPGYYTFSDLPAGCYKVQFTAPAGYLPSPANQGTDDTKDSDPVNGTTGNYLIMDPQLNHLTADAGFYKPVSIGDFVWNDSNANGIQDSGEVGINGVTVALLYCDGTPTGLTTATATVNGIPGYYNFGDLAPGCYKVRFDTPAGFVATAANVNDSTPGGDSVDSDTVSGVSGSYQLTSGANNTTVDAGFFHPAGTGFILTKAASVISARPFSPVTYAYTVLNTGTNTLNNIVVTDDNGTPGFAGDDFTVGTIPSLPSGGMITLTAQLFPVVSTTAIANSTNVAPGTIIVVQLPNGDIKATYLMNPAVNDNTYGTGSIGWTPAHKFNDLKDTDKLEFRFADADGAVVLDFYVDMISAATSVTVPATGQVISYPSGFGTLGPVTVGGPAGSDGSMVTGSINNIVSWSSSISDNLNLAANVPKKASLTVDSPTKLVGNVVTVDAAKAPGGWNYVASYTVVVKAAAFGAAGFGSVAIPDQVNSPSKLGVTQLASTLKNSTVINTARAVSGNLTATATASVDVVVPPPPIPPPCQLAVVSKKLAKTEVQITVTNSGLTDIVVTGFNLTWPATSGKLKQVKFDADIVYDTPDLTSPATVTANQLVADLKKRTITHGTSDVIHLIFEKDGKGDEIGDYSGTFTFGTCSLSILPGCNCNLGYPFVSANPLTSIAFTESDILRLIEPENATTGDTIRVFYNDERALLLGVRNGASSPVTPLTTNPGHAVNPAVGDKTVLDPSGRPLFPALFITDITGISDNAGFTSAAYRAGDWQFGGTPIPPNEIFGTWKGSVKSGADLITDADPAKNNWNLGAGSDVPEVGFGVLSNEGFGTEIRWNINDLRVAGQPLEVGHTYRMQAMIHDGDQNKVGGDVGQACVIVTIKP